MKTKILLIITGCFIFIASSVFSQEPVKKDKTEKKENKEIKEVKEPEAPKAPAAQSQHGQTISSEKKANSKGKGKGIDKSLEVGEPVPGADITLEQEPDDQKIDSKPKDPIIDDMLLEDDR